ncbi:alcohol dehydrogenase catalytic domain-containing protein [Breoghania sp.]|uniref:alcohol dehydrogenase catalytic domain-containing protein n=1 Tax=Breoghania sp. TaxID=2065378 RepID=UPI00262B52C6|nr:alcohol dehydrogenase catalytic domain-containing protein [Breoghania sp.]MDJ0930139.1 alcohol dehydrogenase catalytic domain-containing protein [Breoghania sp.]
MLCAIHGTFGTPSEVLTVAERPLPEPGPGEIRVKTGLAAIHNHDQLTVASTYGYKPALPEIGGSEAMGTIDALGEGVNGLEIGQWVAATRRGTWAQYYIAGGRRRAASQRDSRRDGGPTHRHADERAVPAQFRACASRRLIVQNTATGAVAKVLAKVAQKRGVNVVNLVRRGEAGAAAANLCAICALGATVVSFGLMSGKRMEVPPAQLIFRDITIKGFWLAKLLPEAPKEKVAGLIGELMGLIASGDVTLQVDGIFDLADIAEAAGKGKREDKVLVRG